jgi:hypothetical protein
MAIGKVEKRLGTLILVVLVGVVIGSYLGELVGMLPGGNNVVKNFFTSNVTLGIGDFVHNKPVLIDLSAVKFQIGFQLEFGLLSILGVFVSLYFFRWYR